ncbi:MAG: hypothetical protein OHK003_09150 [Anaerolineales bacterium]
MKDDRVLPLTRIVAVIAIPFLWLAFLILFFFPDQTGERFAWLILYIVTPFLVPALWNYNKQTDPYQPEEADLTIHPAMQWTLRLIGTSGW